MNNKCPNCQKGYIVIIGVKKNEVFKTCDYCNMPYTYWSERNEYKGNRR